MAGWLFENFLLRLRSTKFIGMYHANTHCDIKEKVLKSLTSKNGEIRVIMCTSALGCGVDLNFVLHFGLPHNLIDYVQQIGRAGRDS